MSRVSRSEPRGKTVSESTQGWFIYILRCADDSYYVGHAEEVHGRVAAHNAGEDARWTAACRPVTLVHQESHESLAQAMQRERQIKGWTRAKKAALIAGNAAELDRLSACHKIKSGSGLPFVK